MNFLEGKRVTVIGSQLSLGDKVGLVSMNIDAEKNGIQVVGVETHNLTSENVGDVVISPDSLLRGTVHGSTNIAEHVRRAVNSQIPIVVLVLTSQKSHSINPVEGIKGAVELRGMKDLPEALRIALNHIGQ